MKSKQEAQGQSDEILELARELEHKSNPFPQYVQKPGEGRRHAECLEEARRTVLGDIETIWEQWKNSGQRFRSSHAMVKINKILMEME